LNRRRFLVVGSAWLAVAVGCGPVAPASTPVRVFAAASLTEAFAAIAAEFERGRPGVGVEVHFGGSSQLAMQLCEGAVADVFAAADETNLQRVVDAGLVAGPPVVFARNRLAIVVPSGNPRRVASLADLARGDLRVALCAPEVPAGRYARQALARAGLAVTSLSDEPSVKALVAKVRLGEIDAAIAYATDARGDGLDGVPLPPAHDVVADYPVAVLRRQPGSALGPAFVTFLQSERGRAILAEHGFIAP
jgi:molybdate transport system substrate-binding protein